MDSIQNDGGKVNIPDSWQSAPESSTVTCECCGGLFIGDRADGEVCQRCSEL